LTAEAIADLLERPLYSVTVGELGVTTQDLESKLRQILELAWEWLILLSFSLLFSRSPTPPPLRLSDLKRLILTLPPLLRDAVLLIDEADIFLERRTNNDIKRNAMVGIFLRLLEYHQGVLFLTSNRVKSFDDAFHSRISVALHYESLDKESRRKVFENLLRAAGHTGLDLNKVAEYEINGRQIKNTIRLAQSLAFTEGVDLSSAHLEKTILIAQQFQDDLKSDVLANEPCNI